MEAVVDYDEPQVEFKVWYFKNKFESLLKVPASVNLQVLNWKYLSMSSRKLLSSSDVQLKD